MKISVLSLAPGRDFSLKLALIGARAFATAGHPPNGQRQGE